jgi:hypothetical protein
MHAVGSHAQSGRPTFATATRPGIGSRSACRSRCTLAASSLRQNRCGADTHRVSATGSSSSSSSSTAAAGEESLESIIADVLNANKSKLQRPVSFACPSAAANQVRSISHELNPVRQPANPAVLCTAWLPAQWLKLYGKSCSKMGMCAHHTLGTIHCNLLQLYCTLCSLSCMCDLLFT